MGRYRITQVSKEIRRRLRLYDDSIAFYDTPHESPTREELTLHDIIWTYECGDGFMPLPATLHYAGRNSTSLKEAWIRSDRCTFLSRTRSIRSFKFR